jgi:hypothetical protein
VSFEGRAASLDDIIDRLILLRKVDIGLAQTGQGTPQSESRGTSVRGIVPEVV